MSSIEIRISTATADGHETDFDESEIFHIEAFFPVSAAGILNQLRDISAIKSYILEHDIPANPDSLPTIISPLNDQGEFSISLPSTGSTDHIFLIRIIDQN